MSRQIKFRAFQDGQMVTQPMSGNYAAARFFGFLYEDAPTMQYTGLTDKNGVEIFEGDVLAWSSGNNIKIIWSGNGYAAMYVDESDVKGIFPKHNVFSVIWNKHTEIIGNIYENPELLET